MARAQELEAEDEVTREAGSISGFPQEQDKPS